MSDSILLCGQIDGWLEIIHIPTFTKLLSKQFPEISHIQHIYKTSQPSEYALSTHKKGLLFTTLIINLEQNTTIPQLNITGENYYPGHSVMGMT